MEDRRVVGQREGHEASSGVVVEPTRKLGEAIFAKMGGSGKGINAPQKASVVFAFGANRIVLGSGGLGVVVVRILDEQGSKDEAVDNTAKILFPAADVHRGVDGEAFAIGEKECDMAGVVVGSKAGS